MNRVAERENEKEERVCVHPITADLELRGPVGGGSSGIERMKPYASFPKLC